MSNEINKAFVQQFSDNLIHLLNQEGSMLADTVRKESVQAKYHHFDRIGRGSVVKKTSRHQDTPQNDVAHSRRRVILEDYLWADLIDDEDKVRMLVDPTSDYAKAAAWDMGIQIDKIILAAMTGNAQSIDASDSSSNVALTLTVDEDIGSANSNLNVAKLREAARLIRGSSGGIAGQMYCVINSDALAALLAETEVTSSDYNTVKALVSGEIDSFLGFKFKVVKDGLLSGAGSEADPILCVAYLQRSMGLAMGQDIKIRISERDDKNYATQVHATMSIGATRIEEEGVVSIQCVQT